MTDPDSDSIPMVVTCLSLRSAPESVSDRPEALPKTSLATQASRLPTSAASGFLVSSSCSCGAVSHLPYILLGCYDAPTCLRLLPAA